MNKKYFHTMIDEYSEKLKQYDCVVRNDGTTEREEEFKKLKPKIEKLFKVFEGKLLFIGNDDSYKGTHLKPNICYNFFNIGYHHNGHYSNIKIEMIDALTNMLVDVSSNFFCVKKYDFEVTFIQIINDIVDYKQKMGGKNE